MAQSVALPVAYLPTANSRIGLGANGGSGKGAATDILGNIDSKTRDRVEISPVGKLLAESNPLTNPKAVRPSGEAVGANNKPAERERALQAGANARNQFQETVAAARTKANERGTESRTGAPSPLRGVSEPAAFNTTAATRPRGALTPQPARESQIVAAAENKRPGLASQVTAQQSNPGVTQRNGPSPANPGTAARNNPQLAAPRQPEPETVARKSQTTAPEPEVNRLNKSTTTLAAADERLPAVNQRKLVSLLKSDTTKTETAIPKPQVPPPPQNLARNSALSTYAKVGGFGRQADFISAGFPGGGGGGVDRFA